MESPIVPKIRGQDLWSSGGRSGRTPETSRTMPSAKLLFEIVAGRLQVRLALHGAQLVDVRYHNWLQVSHNGTEKTVPRKKNAAEITMSTLLSLQRMIPNQQFNTPLRSATICHPIPTVLLNFKSFSRKEKQLPCTRPHLGDGTGVKEMTMEMKSHT